MGKFHGKKAADLPKKTPKPDIMKSKLLAAMKSTLGNVSAACQQVGCQRSYYYELHNNDVAFAKEIIDIQEMVIDFAEGKLMELVNSLNPAAILFTLKCKGKKRGWIERTEIEISEKVDLSNLTTDEIVKRAKAARELET